MMRLFVGIGLDPAVSSPLARINGGIPGARWVQEHDFHITLIFVGEIDEGLAADLDGCLTRIRQPRFSLTVEGLNTFGHAKPHTLWAGVAPSTELSHLQTKTTQVCHELSIPVERRKFVPHVTLARLSDPPIPKLQSFITEHSPLQGGSFTVRQFTLFESLPASGTTTYRPLVDYPLT